MRKFLLIILLVLPGVAGAIIFTVYAVQDYRALMAAYQQFEHIARSSHDLSALFVAESQQNIFRINLFAEGVWALLSAIVAAIGVHGLCVARSGDRQRGH